MLGYLAPDENTVFCAGGRIRFSIIPGDEADSGVVTPVKQTLCCSVIQSNPKFISGGCRTHGHRSEDLRLSRCWKVIDAVVLVLYIILNSYRIKRQAKGAMFGRWGCVVPYPSWEMTKLCSSMLWMLTKSPSSLRHSFWASVHVWGVRWRWKQWPL